MSACIVKLVLRYHTCILPPSYFINRFSILGTFLLLCFYLSFSFLQFFLIYNLKLNLYIKSTKTTTISRLKLHWQAQLSNAEDIEVRMPLFLFWFLCSGFAPFFRDKFPGLFQDFSRPQIEFSRTLKFTLTLSFPRSQC